MTIYVDHKGYEYEVEVEFKLVHGFYGDVTEDHLFIPVTDVDILELKAEIEGRPIKWRGALELLEELAIEQILQERC